MVEDIDLSELLRAVEQVREIYRAPLPRQWIPRPARRTDAEFGEPARKFRLVK
jgi:hypothetical protein